MAQSANPVSSNASNNAVQNPSIFNSCFSRYTPISNLLLAGAAVITTVILFSQCATGIAILGSAASSVLLLTARWVISSNDSTAAKIRDCFKKLCCCFCDNRDDATGSIRYRPEYRQANVGSSGRPAPPVGGNVRAIVGSDSSSHRSGGAGHAAPPPSVAHQPIPSAPPAPQQRSAMRRAAPGSKSSSRSSVGSGHAHPMPQARIEEEAGSRCSSSSSSSQSLAASRAVVGDATSFQEDVVSGAFRGGPQGGQEGAPFVATGARAGVGSDHEEHAAPPPEGT